jgi:iron complex outermembrane receptor protein
MKKFLGTMSLTFLTLLVFGQNNHPLRGKITDRSTKQPISGVVVQLNNLQVVTDDNGQFNLKWTGTGSASLKIRSLGYREQDILISKSATEKDLTIELEPGSLFLQPLEVRSIRATDKAPFAKTNLAKEEIVNPISSSKCGCRKRCGIHRYSHSRN